MTARTAGAVILVILLFGALTTLLTCDGGDHDTDDSGFGLAVDRGRRDVLRLDLPLVGFLQSRELVAEDAGDEGRLETVEAAAPTPVEPCGSRYPTDNDILRATWATSYFDGMDWAIVPLLEVEWCESCRQTTLVGAASEVGPFQFLPSTWQRFTKLWFKERGDPPPVDPLDPWDAALMTVFAWQQGHMGEWHCWEWQRDR